MFNYIGLTPEQIDKLEASDYDDLAKAGLMLLEGERKGIISRNEALDQCHNLFLAII